MRHGVPPWTHKRATEPSRKRQKPPISWGKIRKVPNLFILTTPQTRGFLRYIHSEKVLHRDLKTSNIFLSEGGNPGRGPKRRRLLLYGSWIMFWVFRVFCFSSLGLQKADSAFCKPIPLGQRDVRSFKLFSPPWGVDPRNRRWGWWQLSDSGDSVPGGLFWVGFPGGSGAFPAVGLRFWRVLRWGQKEDARKLAVAIRWVPRLRQTPFWASGRWFHQAGRLRHFASARGDHGGEWGRCGVGRLFGAVCEVRPDLSELPCSVKTKGPLSSL